MKGHVLSTSAIATKNIQRNPLRSFGLVVTIALFAFALFVGSLLSMSLSGGVESLSDRLGADVMVVPEGYDPHIDSILLSGKPSSFYLPKDVMERLQGVEGIEKMTPQTFLATLNASCCSYPVQLVGIDEKTDFLIKPWLDRTLKRELRDGEIILGHHVAGDLGDHITFFKNPYNVAGRLEQTGMGFDATVFMTRKTIAKLAVAAERIIKHPLARDGSLISTVMIKLKPGYSSTVVAKEINRQLNHQGIYALFSKKFVNEISSNLMVVSGLIKGVILIVWILAVVVIALLFAITLGERKKEMGVLRVLGATKAKLLWLVLTEAWLISLYGAVLGVILGGILMMVTGPMMVELLKIPFLLPSWYYVVGLGGVSIVLAMGTSLLSAAYSAVRAGYVDIYENMKGE